MADYRDLLRRAVEALPENNGNARRQVYDKARKALRNQLDAIKPELPSREKTFHRLQLEECIREVEQEATERLLGGFSQFDSEALHLDRAPAKAHEHIAETVGAAAEPMPEPEEVVADPIAPEPEPAGKAEPAAKAEDKPQAKAKSSKLPDPVSEKALPSSGKTTRDGGSGPTSIDDVIRQAQSVAEDAARPVAAAKSTAATKQATHENRAMSTVREVEVEENDDGTGDPQKKIDHAIAMLDREANGEGSDYDDSVAADPATADIGFAKGELAEERGGNALTIFLVIFALLLVGVGGAGYWAWREGYVDMSALFGQAEVASTPATEQPQGATSNAEAAETPPVETGAANGGTVRIITDAGPGNTSTSSETPAPTAEAVVTGSEVTSDPTSGGPNTETTSTPTIAEASPSIDTDKIEERLPTEEAQPAATETASTSDTQPSDVAAVGGQSLLLEASEQGTTGAVPFSGTVEWNRGSDELGQPTLIATAKIPARNLGMKVLIRKNSDPALPASHIMEIDFEVTDSFVGGGVARIAGVLMKDEELVQGVPLIGASARVVGNSFLFALSASPQDVSSNGTLLQARKWMDFAMVYSTGKQAIITLEKDDSAQALFDEVSKVWDSEPAPAAGEGATQ